MEDLHHCNPNMFLQNNNTAYLMYNDGVPKSVNYSRKYGHSKGMTKALSFSFLLKVNIFLNILSSIFLHSTLKRELLFFNALF